MNETLAQYRSVLSSRNARLVLGADALSKAGDWFMYVAMSLLVYRGGGAGALGIFSVLRIGIPLSIGPLAGRWGNSRPPRTVMIGCDIARAVVVGVGAAAAALGAHVTVLMAVTVVAAVFTTVFAPAERRMHRDLVRPDERAALNSTIGTTGTTVIVLAPALAGGLAATLGIPWLLAVNAASFLVSAALVVLLDSSLLVDAEEAGRDEESADGGKPRQGVLREVAVVLRNDRFVALCLACQTIACAVASASLVLQVAVADRAGDATALLGWITTAIGVGSVLGMVLGGPLAKRNRLVPGAACAVILSLLLGVFGTSTNAVMALASAVAMGLSAGLPESLYWTSFQNRVPKDSSGAFFGLVESTTTAAMAFGGAAIGGLVAAFGTSTGSWILALPLAGLALVTVVAAVATDRGAPTAAPVPAPEDVSVKA
ncbi:MFS transporter [Streptomyces sp. NPDC019224]|uniref:MFS transporter n=1 Tax=Streptomyces sp. NPDC019224 TaxID=3154484 RepID=UPI003410A86B